jgi:2-iminobutanoate/2-iminopropanoate deaminase
MLKKVVDTDRAPAAIGPYSQGIVAGQFLFVSGQTPLDPATEKLVDGGIKEQTKRALDNIVGILEAAGTGLDLNSLHDAQSRSRGFPKTQRWR